MASPLGRPSPVDTMAKQKTATYATSAHGSCLELFGLPIEIHIRILSFLPWKSHIPCMQVCTLWRDLLSTRTFTNKRYTGIYKPRLPLLLSQGKLYCNSSETYQFQIQFSGGRITSTRLIEPVGRSIRGNNERPEDKALKGLELRRDCILADPLFYHINMRDLTPDEQEERESIYIGGILPDFNLEGFAIRAYARDKNNPTFNPTVDDQLQWCPEDSLAGLHMPLWGLLQRAVAFVAGTKYLTGYKHACMELGIFFEPIFKMPEFYAQLRSVEWEDGRKAEGLEGVFDGLLFEGCFGLDFDTDHELEA